VYAFHIGSISYCIDCPGFTPRTTWRDYDCSHAMDVRVTLLPPLTVWGMPADWIKKPFVEDATQFMAAAVASVFADGLDTSRRTFGEMTSKCTSMRSQPW
jgi:hypothetical protein